MFRCNPPKTVNVIILKFFNGFFPPMIPAGHEKIIPQNKISSYNWQSDIVDI